jgi:aspartate kinase
MNPTVVKVGGSLLAGPADLRKAAAAIAQKHRADGALLVVASALKGVTDRLDLAASQALDRAQNGHLGETLDDLRRRHLDAAREIADGTLAERIEEALGEVEALVRGIRASGELPDAVYARLLSSGERLSALLFASAVEAAGAAAEPVTAEAAGLRALGPARSGACDLQASAEGFRWMRRQLTARVLVLTGFYGVGGDGEVVLFGRGGSDDTACAVAAGLDARRLELWKDVPGLMSADPYEVEDARVIPEVSFDEVAQLGAFGSRVVHHGCLAPLRGRAIEICISSLPEAAAPCGTRLVERLHRDRPRVVALASRRRAPALIGLVGDGVAADPEIRSRMLSCLTAAGARGALVAQPSGRSGLSCTVHPDDLAPVLSGLHESFFPSSFPTSGGPRP